MASLLSQQRPGPASEEQLKSQQVPVCSTSVTTEERKPKASPKKEDGDDEPKEEVKEASPPK